MGVKVSSTRKKSIIPMNQDIPDLDKIISDIKISPN